MKILGGRGDLTQILDLFPIFEKISDIFGRRCVQCTCVCDSAIIWKRLDSFFGWSLNLKVFVVALHMNTQLWYRKGYKIPKKMGHPIVHCTCVCDSAIICTNDCPPSTSLTWTYFFFGKKHALPAIIMLNLIFHIAMDNLVKKKLFSLARNGGGGVWTAIWITCAILPQREKAEVS